MPIRTGKPPLHAQEEEALKAFVCGLLEPTRERVAPPRCLLELAARTLRKARLEARLTPDDLVSELTVRILERRDRLANVKSYRGVLLHRLRQLASEAVPGRRQYRELKAHVKHALTKKVEPSTSCRPEALEVEGRFVRKHVVAAVAWALGQPNPPLSPRALTSFLMEAYALGAQQVALEDWEDLGPQEGAAQHGGLLAAELMHHLGERNSRMLAHRLAGHGLEEISRSLGVATSTAFAQLRRSEFETVDFIQRWQSSETTARSALKLIANLASTAPLARGLRVRRPLAKSDAEAA